MFSRIIRDKIPGIDELNKQFTDSAGSDRDIVQKEKGKEAADKKRWAKKIDIKIGDKVLVQNVVYPNKLTLTFDQTEFEVLGRHKNIVKIAGGAEQ